MATFDEKSIFGKRDELEETKVEEIAEDEIEGIEVDEEEIVEEITIAEPAPKDDSVRVVGEDLVESERARKERIKREKREKKLQDREYQAMVKAHKKALKLNPENIKRYESDPEKGLPNEIVEKRVLDELVNITKKGSTKSKKAIVFSNIFTFFNMIISSRTTSWTPISCFSPSRTTLAVGADNNDNLSIVFLALISW